MTRKLMMGLLILAVSLAAIGCAQTEKQDGTSGTGQKEPPAAVERDDKSGDETQPGAGAAIEAEIDDFAFKPAEIKVKVNDKVVWENKDSEDHTVVADDGSFESGPLAEGQSYEKVFAKAGTYAYHCGVHPSMKGTVVVE